MTILIPTFRHPRLLPFAIQSALDQQGVAVEVFVVGDGVEDDTREALAPFLEDQRVTFFDCAKGERHGELNRHQALREARGRIVLYLSDDDLLLPDHAAELSQLLERADFAHSAPFLVDQDGSLRFAAIDLAESRFWPFLLHGRWNKIVLTGAGHTLEAYRRLPYGWRPAPSDVWTDLHMWRQFLALPGLRARTGDRITALHLADQHREQMSMDERVAELEHWHARIASPGFAEELERAAAVELRRVAVSHELRIQELKHALVEVQSTRLWRLRTAAASLRSPRALLADRRGAH